MSGEMRRNDREASRKLQEAADGIRNNRLEEQIHYSGSLMRQSGQTNADLERNIGNEIENLAAQTGRGGERRRRGRQEQPHGQQPRSRAQPRARRRLDAAADARRAARSAGPSRASKVSRASRASKVSRVSRANRVSRASRVNRASRASRANKAKAQGQQGQQGQQGPTGPAGPGRTERQNRGGDNRGDGSFGGSATDGDNWGGWGQRVYTPGEIRNFRDQARYWTGEAQRLRDQLRNDGVNPADLDEVLRAMRQLDDDRVYKDARELERLQTQVAEV